MAAWLNHSVHFGGGRPLDGRFETVEDVERRDDVETVVWERCGGNRSAGKPRPTSLPPDSQADSRQIEAVGLSELRQQSDIVTSATAAIEQPKVCTAGGRLTKQWQNEESKSSEPEMR